MPSLSDSFLQELKLKTDVVDVVSSYVSLKKRGNTYVGLCPFHNEKTPSFTVYENTQSFYCFGCGAGGDSVSFMRKIENLDYIDAVKLLAQRAGMQMPDDGYDDSISKKRRTILQIKRETAKFYHAYMMSEQGKIGLQYYLDRGLSIKTIRHFGLGYAPNQWDALLKHLKSKGFSVTDMAAAGVATATAIAQYASAGLIMTHLLRRKDECHVSLKKVRLHKDTSIAILMIGVPAGIQNAIFAIANLFVQSGVNSFDTYMVSGNAAATNADTIIYNVMYAFYIACSSFMSQNYGAGNKKRVLKSYFISLFYSFSIGLILGLLLFLFGHQFLSLFATDAAVIDAGMQRIKIMAFSYCVSSFMDCTIAASRGIGKTIIPTIIIIMGSCVFRIIWIYTIFAWVHTIPALFLLYLFSWIITSIAEIIYFTVSYRKLSVR